MKVLMIMSGLALACILSIRHVRPVIAQDSKQTIRKPEQVKKLEPQVEKLFNGKDLTGWRVVAVRDFKAHGRIEIKNGELLLHEGSPMTGIRCSAELPRMDYELILDAKRTGGTDFFCGLTFPVAKSHCTLILGGWGGSLVGLSNVDGMPANENETTQSFDFKVNRWYQVRLRVTRERIEVSIGKEKLIDLKTKGRKFSIWPEQEPIRPLGMATWYTSSAYRNVRLKRMKSSETK